MTDSATASSSSGEVACTYHPDVQTGLRCTRCGKPICPRCGVRTPVGLRCPDCAGIRGLPTIRTSSSALLRATGAALVVGMVVAMLWYVLPEWKFYLSLALGFGVAESMAYLVRGKRGPDLQIAAVVVVTLAALAARALLAWKYGIGIDELTSGERLIVVDGDKVVAGTASDFLQLRLVPDLLFLALSYAIVWIRFR